MSQTFETTASPTTNSPASPRALYRKVIWRLLPFLVAAYASNGIEPAFAWSCTRRKRLPEGGTREYEVEDHALRLYRQRRGERASGFEVRITGGDVRDERLLSGSAEVGELLVDAVWHGGGSVPRTVYLEQNFLIDSAGEP